MRRLPVEADLDAVLQLNPARCDSYAMRSTPCSTPPAPHDGLGIGQRIAGEGNVSIDAEFSSVIAYGLDAQQLGRLPL